MGTTFPVRLSPDIAAGHRHRRYRRTPISNGDTIYLELTGTHLRYNAPQCRTASIGPAAAVLREQAEDSLRALESLIAHLAPGRTPIEVMADVGRDAPFRTTGTANSGTFGYSVGMAFKPCWTENPYYLNASNSRPLEAGMVLYTPISVYRPAVTSAIFSETVLITDSGCEVLTGGGPGRHLECL